MAGKYVEEFTMRYESTRRHRCPLPPRRPYEEKGLTGH
jgi:hypothetical protein